MVDPVSGFVLKVLGNVLDKLATDLVRSAVDKAIAGTPVREIAPGNVKRTVDRAADKLVELRPATLPDNEWHAAVAAVHDALEAVRPIDIDLVLDAGADPLRLNEQVRARTEHIKTGAALNPAAQHTYDLVLSASCGHIVDLVRLLPDFDRLLQSRTLQEVNEIDKTLREIPRQIDRRRESEFLEFEQEYTRYVAKNIKFELFGVTRGRAPRKQSFEDSYVSLAVARSARNDADDDREALELTGAGIGAANAFADYTRVLLRGGAGSGKTTLLRWLAVQAARGSLLREINGWSEVVPFFLPLRQFISLPLPTPGEFANTVLRTMSGVPQPWVHTQLRAGRALLLVDGIDELPSERRSEIKEWLDELVTRYPRTRYVVTTRPFAVEGDWLAELGFVTFDLLPLSAKGVRDLLTCWHNAARSEHEFDEDKQAWLNKCETGLAGLLSMRSDLRKLAASPLLCGLLCALYQDGNMQLPRDRKSLYEAALDLLLVRWDEQRHLTVGSGLSLNKEEQLMLLQVFAYSLVKNSQNSLDIAEATRRFTHGMRGLRHKDASPTTVLRHMLERTGLLLEPYPDQVEFVHRTFRDYLAAKEVVDCGDYNLLVQNAHLDQWHDVVVMAVAQAPRRQRDKVLEALLRGNDETRRNDRRRDRLHLVAAACLEQTSVVDSEEVRRRVQEAAARLIPPAGPDEAEVLAKAGPFVLDLLPGPDGLSDAQAAWIVRTIAAIGGEGAAEKIAAFKDLDESVVIEELLRAWRQSDSPEEYARSVLADVDFRDRQLDVRSYHRAQQLRHLRRLRNVRCRGDLRDLSVFAEVPVLRCLELMTNELVRDLRPLAQCRQLRTLRLTFCLELRDLSPLAGTTVEELALHTMRVDLGTLRGARLRTLSIRDHAIDNGLHPLPDELPLRELAVDNRPPYRSLLGIERWQTLERVSVFGVPSEDEVSALTSLPALDHLVITGPESAQHLRQLERLTSLRRLDVNNLDGLSSGERDAVLLVLRNLPYEMYLNGQPLAGNA